MKRSIALLVLLCTCQTGCQSLVGSGIYIQPRPGGEAEVDVRIVIDDTVVVDTGIPPEMGPRWPMGPRIPRHLDRSTPSQQ